MQWGVQGAADGGGGGGVIITPRVLVTRGPQADGACPSRSGRGPGPFLLLGREQSASLASAACTLPGLHTPSHPLPEPCLGKAAGSLRTRPPGSTPGNLPLPVNARKEADMISETVVLPADCVCQTPHLLVPNPNTQILPCGLHRSSLLSPGGTISSLLAGDDLRMWGGGCTGQTAAVWLSSWA